MYIHKKTILFLVLIATSSVFMCHGQERACIERFSQSRAAEKKPFPSMAKDFKDVLDGIQRTKRNIDSVYGDTPGACDDNNLLRKVLKLSLQGNTKALDK